MKIVVTGTRGFPDVQGGVESHCEHLYLSLVKYGCDITVFTRKPYTIGESRVYRGVKLIPVRCPRNKFLEAVVHTFKCVLMAKQLRPEILHIHAIGPSLFVPLARILNMKVVVTNHGPDYMRGKWSLPAKLFLKFCEKMGVLFANEVIVIADNIADDIKQKYGRSSTVIPNGVNVPHRGDTDEYIREYGLKDQRYILTVGRFVPEKGFSDLIDAFDAGNFGPSKLVIVGGADHENKYSLNLKAKAKKNDNIILTGVIKGQPLHELYSNADLFVLPSYHEGLPIVLLEAMSYGLSCIASDIPANRNVSLNEDRFFKTGDIQSITTHIDDFLNKQWDEEDREKQISMINELYNWEKIADETLKVYRRIVI